MRSYLINSTAVAICTVMVATSGSFSEANARGNGIGTALGIGGALIIMNEAAKAMNVPQGQSEPRRRSGGGSNKKDSGDKDDGDDDESSKSKQSDTKATQARAKASAEYEKAMLILQNELAETKRNVERAVTLFINELVDQHKKLRGSDANVRVSSLNPINQVTAGEVRRLLDEEYMTANLSRFDKFAGELWTRDRLMVEILTEAKLGLKPYFEGVGAKGPSIEDLKAVFRTSASEVYSRALEMSEIIGVSYSFDRFVRTISENSDRVPAKLMTIGADGQYERLLTKAINTVPSENFIAASATPTFDPSGMKRQFQFRFRARRSLYDCLSSNYVEIATGKPERHETIPVGVVRIDTLQPMAGTGGANRGATLQAKPSDIRPAANDGPVPTVQEVWGRVQDHVQAKCKNTIMVVADEARGKGLQPQPARWDTFSPISGGNSNGGNSNPGLQPILNLQGAGGGRQ